ncbi:MAG: radical SAM protein [Lachnospiraceae bacterium]|nr:radical SAM protein [Lachnospiraceae bacterium]
MNEPQNGFEFLEEIKKINGKKTQSFNSFYKYLDIKAREKGVPIHGQFELTPICNFDCKMCYVHLNKDQLGGREVLSVDKWKELMHQAFEAGMMCATLTGGECLAYPGFEELYLYLNNLGCEINVLTNGYLLDERRIDFFKHHRPNLVKITLYGWNDDVYERVTGRRVFSVVEKNISKALEADLPIRISITPSTYLGEDVFETIRVSRNLVKDVFVNSALFNPREETGKSEMYVDANAEMYVRIYKLLNELNGIETKEIAEDKLPPAGNPLYECGECGLQCGGGRSSFVIDWKGTLMPCNRLNIIKAFPLLDGFAKAWKSVNKKANSWPRVSECQGCAYRGVCSNCSGNTLQYVKPGERPTELCKRTKFFVQQGIAIIPECD